MNSFPVIFLVSIIACVVATFTTPAESDEVLIKFYTTVRPWGFWKPVRDKVLEKNPGFVPNKDFKRDMVNVLIGVVWQITLVAAPVYLVIREYTSFLIIVGIMIITSIILKFNWWDKLEDVFVDEAHKIKIKLKERDLQITEESR
jgi:hypothetical protein